MHTRRLAGALFLAIAARGQKAAFDIASIKKALPEERAGIARSGNRLTFTNMSVEALIKWAYDLQDDRLLQKPKGLASTGFDIEAKGPEGEIVRGGLKAMMRSLLASRFGLMVHPETRELPMYSLVVAKNGLKVHLTNTGGGGQNPFSMPGRGHLVGTGVTADMLAKVLSEQLGRSVDDRTGVQGVFDFKLQWAPNTDVPFAAVDGGEGASLFTAIEEQLGFRLEPHKGPAEVLVIDHVQDAPTDN